MNRAGIYVQVPFCQTKCTYCNFHTGVVASSRFAPYISAVCHEIKTYRELYAAAGITLPATFEETIVDTMYIGGGTPSLLDPLHVKNLVDAVRQNFRAELSEVTLEADPETIEPGKAAAWRNAGITRVSFGVQSFCDKELIAAGRMHRRADIYRAAAILREVGMQNISFDLIAGLPHQTRESWKQSLEELLELAPQHVSIYLLEIDEGSRLGLEVLQAGARYSVAALPAEDDMADFYEFACEVLQAAGYHHYEISNWAKTVTADKPGLQSRHNLKYWRREPYLGFGAGAHSFSGAERWANAHDAAQYVESLQSGRLPKEQHEVLGRKQALEEEFFLGLRQLDGIDVQRIEREYGVGLGERFAPLLAQGLIEKNGSVVRLARARLSVSNEVFVELMK